MLESGDVINDLLKVANREHFRIKLAEAQDEDIEVRGRLSNGMMVRGILVDIVGDVATIRDKNGRDRQVAFDTVEDVNEVDAAKEKNIREEQKALRPSFMSIDPIEFDDEGTVAKFLGYLAGPGKIRLSLEVPPKYRDMAVEQYRELTGETIVPERGLFNIAPEDKWSFEAAIHFIPTDDIPPVFARLQIERPGLISRVQLFWSLIKLGFTLTRRQNPDKIRESLDPMQWQFFDEGLGKPS
jgi:hypothetical protein